MMYKPRITLEIQGIERLQMLIQKARTQMNELESTLEQIRSETLSIQAKINQPPSETEGS